MNDNVHTLQELTSSGVNVTGIVDNVVSMCVAIYNNIFYYFMTLAYNMRFLGFKSLLISIQ